MSISIPLILILHTGSLPAKALQVFRSINVQQLQERPFSGTKKRLYIQLSEKEQETLLNQLTDKRGLILGGDGRADIPGHSVK